MLASHFPLGLKHFDRSCHNGEMLTKSAFMGKMTLDNGLNPHWPVLWAPDTSGKLSADGMRSAKEGLH